MHGQALEAPEENAAPDGEVIRVGSKADLGVSSEQLGDRDPCLNAGELGSEAGMDSVPEGYVATGFSDAIECSRITVGMRIVSSRENGDQDPITCGNLLAPRSIGSDATRKVATG